MNDVRQRLEYRISGRRFGLVLLLMGIGAVLIMVRIGGDTYSPGWLRAGGVVAGLLGVIAVVAYARLSSTVADQQQIAVRGLLRGRRFRWSEVQRIQIEINPGGYAKQNAPRQMIVLYDSTGRRTVLPHLNEKNLDELHTSLSTEVNALHRLWEAGRGKDWAPLPQAQRRAADRAGGRVSPWAVGP